MPEAPYRDPHDPQRTQLASVPDSAYRPLSRRQARLRVYAPIYGALVAMYLAIWQGYLVASVGIVAGIFALVVWRAVQRNRAVRLVRANEEAVATLNAGDVQGAAKLFDGLATEARGVPIVHALLVFNRGATAMRLGDIDRAIELTQRAVQSGWIADASLNLASLAGSNMGTCLAIKGDLDAAERWQREAHAAVAPSKRGSLLVLDALIACRRGRYVEAIAQVERDWALAEGGLNAAQLRGVRLLRAFALEQTGGEADEIASLIAGAKPFRTGEQDYLAGSWPEFRAFLVKHGFSAG